MNIVTYKCLRKGKSILKYKHGEKSTKVLFMVYVDIESLLQKIDIGYSNPETAKINKHTGCGLFIIYALFIRNHKKASTIIIYVTIAWKRPKGGDRTKYLKGMPFFIIF